MSMKKYHKIVASFACAVALMTPNFALATENNLKTEQIKPNVSYNLSNYTYTLKKNKITSHAFVLKPGRVKLIVHNQKYELPPRAKDDVLFNLWEFTNDTTKTFIGLASPDGDIASAIVYDLGLIEKEAVFELTMSGGTYNNSVTGTVSVITVN